MARCWIDKNREVLGDIGKNKLLKEWWSNLEEFLPAFQRAKNHSAVGGARGFDMRKDKLLKGWLDGGKLTEETLVKVVRTVMVWVSWIHEDVGHSAAAYVRFDVDGRVYGVNE